MRGSLNLVALCGEVIKVETAMVRGALTTKVRLAVASSVKKCVTDYVDVYGFYDLGKEMLMQCSLGTIVYVEGRISNSAKGRNVLAPFISVTDMQCLLRPREPREPTYDMIALLDQIDPIGFYESKKEKRKVRKRDRNDDEG